MIDPILNDLFMKNLKFPVFIGEKCDFGHCWTQNGHKSAIFEILIILIAALDSLWKSSLMTYI